MRTTPVAALLLLSLITGCKKSSPAQPALESFLTLVAQRRTNESTSYLAEGTTAEATDPGAELTEGVAKHFIVAIGDHDWSRFKLESETIGADGSRTLVVIDDLCLVFEGQAGGCTRPNSYRYTARMVNEGGAWRIAASTFEQVSQVR